MIHTFVLQDGTRVDIKDDKKYRIGLQLKKRDNSKYIETFYLLSPQEIKKYIKKYNGELNYIIEM